jgi:hypothetical protein
MADAITAAKPFAGELSRAPVKLKTAFALDLVEACQGGVCDAPATGAGWGVVFDITAPDGKPGQVLVVLDAANHLIHTQQ